MLPVRLDEQETAAGAERFAGCGEHKVGSAAVVQRVVEQGRVEAAFEVETLHVGDLEGCLGAFLLGELARNRDHLR